MYLNNNTHFEKSTKAKCPWYNAGFIAYQLVMLFTSWCWLLSDKIWLLAVTFTWSTRNWFFLQRSYATPTKLVDAVFGTLLYITTRSSSKFLPSFQINSRNSIFLALFTVSATTTKISFTLWKENETINLYEIHV